MSDELIEHVRYPADLFKVQRAILETYHVTDAETFYSGDDAWVTPDDPTSPANAAKLQPPYYLTMQVPGTDEPAFTLYSTFIPKSQATADNQSVLTGYLAVNADAGRGLRQADPADPAEGDTVPGPGQVQNNFIIEHRGGQRAEHPARAVTRRSSAATC